MTWLYFSPSEIVWIHRRRYPRKGQHSHISWSFGQGTMSFELQIMRIWGVMDECIRTGVSTTERTLPGRLGLRRRAPMLYRRLMRGFVSVSLIYRGSDTEENCIFKRYPDSILVSRLQSSRRLVLDGHRKPLEGLLGLTQG